MNKRVPGIFGEDAGAHAVGGLGAAVEILDEQLAASRMGDEISEQRLELGWRDRAVVRPPDLAFGRFVLDDELVLGRTARMDAGIGDERAAMGEARLAALERLFDQKRGVEIGVDALELLEAECLGPLRGVQRPDHVHAQFPSLEIERLASPLPHRGLLTPLETIDNP